MKEDITKSNFNSLGKRLTDEAIRNLKENTEAGADGKIPVEIELDRSTGRKLDKLSKKLAKPEGEVVEQLITTHLDKIESGNICCFCNKKLGGVGK